jgi:hypothetical protein
MQHRGSTTERLGGRELSGAPRSLDEAARLVCMLGTVLLALSVVLHFASLDASSRIVDSLAMITSALLIIAGSCFLAAARLRAGAAAGRRLSAGSHIGRKPTCLFPRRKETT